jgi:hypothetical protein
MAKRKHHRRRRRSNRHRRHVVRHRNPVALFGRPRRRRRHASRRHNRRMNRRRNPSLREMSSGIIPAGAGALAGFFGSRFIPQNVPGLSQYNTGITGYLLNGAVGGAISWALWKFWNRTAGMGAAAGTVVAIVSRIVVDQSAAPSSAAAPAAQQAAMSGLGSDMDFDLGYYVSDPFPFPQGNAGGPYGIFPGSPMGGAPALTTSASAVRAGQAAAAAALPAAAAGGGGVTAERWSNNWS